MLTRVFSLVCIFLPARAVVLKSKSYIRGSDARAVHRFLATPANWPKFVLSSVAVEGSDVGRPLRKGGRVEEVFGAPPLLPLSVTWECEATDEARGVLDVRSPLGLASVACDARMLFQVEPTPDGASVALEMSYEPLGALARLATPVLSVDNWLALHVLLPAALRTPLDRFRSLMCSLYGVAGAAHCADLLLGPSQLLQAAGAPPFSELPPAAQALALVWCATGPVALLCTRSADARVMDLGLVQYGLVECLGAALISSTSSASSDVLLNAIIVQLVVRASWVYSSRAQTEPVTGA